MYPVPGAGLEPARLAAGDFETTMPKNCVIYQLVKMETGCFANSLQNHPGMDQ